MLVMLILGPTFASGAPQFYSQAHQDEFVHILLYEQGDKEDEGTYLEIGAADPIEINNTYMFEKEYGWRGVSLDCDARFILPWAKRRSNPLLYLDALSADYKEMLKEFPAVIDYLTLDIDGLYDEVLLKIPFDEHVFKIITIEHDAYRFGNRFRDAERAILTALGYRCVAGNIKKNGHSFEDWWIYESAFSEEWLMKIETIDLDNKESSDVIKALRALSIN